MIFDYLIGNNCFGLICALEGSLLTCKRFYSKETARPPYALKDPESGREFQLADIPEFTPESNAVLEVVA